LKREDVGRGGIVKDPALHAAAVEKIRAFVETMPPRADGRRLKWAGVIESPILGGEGNKEFLALLTLAAAV
jgi:23S rRNA (cytidine1920-2'-O)/16S rRNA (cytidine1409-2'-O)-methyltransferase